jgi:hypothetical protein
LRSAANCVANPESDLAGLSAFGERQCRMKYLYHFGHMFRVAGAEFVVHISQKRKYSNDHSADLILHILVKYLTARKANE